jgi:hypothetical protein
MDGYVGLDYCCICLIITGFSCIWSFAWALIGIALVSIFRSSTDNG